MSITLIFYNVSIADNIKMDKTYLETAKTDITLSKLKIIADVLGVEPKDLLDFK